MAGRDILITDQGSVVFNEDETGGLNSVKLQGPNALGSDYTIKLPNAVASGGGQILQASGAGDTVTLSFGTESSAGMAGLNVLTQVDGADTAADSNNRTAGIVTAINNAESSGASDGNERLIFPAGGYKIAQLGKVGTADCFSAVDGSANQNSYWLEGAGAGHTTLFNVHDNDGSMIEHIADNGAGVQSHIFVLKDMTINGNDRVSTGAEKAAVNLRADYVFIDNVEFTNMGPAIRILGSPKLVAITNCRFTGMKANTGATDVQNLIRIDETESDFPFIFTDNYVVGATPTSPDSGLGLGQGGLEVLSAEEDDNITCFISRNYFKELGNNTNPVVSIGGGAESVVSDNVFESVIGTAIKVVDSPNTTISNNKVASVSLKQLAADTVNGIHVEAVAASREGVRVTGNTLLSSVSRPLDTGIYVQGDASAQVTYLKDVIVSDNIVDGASVSIETSNIRGILALTGNSCRNSGNITPSFAAMHIGNLNGDTQIRVEGNVFTGGATSGRAIYMDRNSSATDTAGNVHFLLKDNFIDSMGQVGSWALGTVADMSLVYIVGHASDDVLKTFHASGNRYDLTSTNANTYPVRVANVKGKCTFDSVLEFGAIGDGTTNDTLALNMASQAAGANGSIKVPLGTFMVTDYGVLADLSTPRSSGTTGCGIEVAAANQTWHGEGTIKENSTTLHAIKCLTFPTTFKDISFTCATSNTASSAIVTSDATGDRVQGCTFTAFGGPVVHLQGPNASVRDCTFSETAGNSIEGVSASTDATIANNTITNAAVNEGESDNGVYGQLLRGIITGNQIRNVSNDSIQLVAGSDRVRMSHNTISRCGSHAIKVSGCADISISDNTIFRDDEIDGASGAEDILLTDVVGAAILSNVINSYQTKVQIAGTSTSHISISSNVFDMSDDDSAGTTNRHCINIPDATTLSGLSITSNHLYCSTVKWLGAAIYVGATDKSIITGNRINKFTTGIQLIAGAEDNLLTSNLMDDVDQEVVDAGTDTLSFYTTSTPVLQSDIFRIGKSTNAVGGYTGAGTVDSLVVWNVGDSGAPDDELCNAISVTSSFHFIKASLNAVKTLKKIKINGLHTRTADCGGNDEQALATAIYDGMILYLVLRETAGTSAHVLVQSTDTTITDAATIIRNTDAAAVTDRGGNILSFNGADAAAASTIHYNAYLDIFGAITSFRFEHDGTQGMWRPLFEVIPEG